MKGLDIDLGRRRGTRDLRPLVEGPHRLHGDLHRAARVGDRVRRGRPRGQRLLDHLQAQEDDVLQLRLLPRPAEAARARGLDGRQPGRSARRAGVRDEGLDLDRQPLRDGRRAATPSSCAPTASSSCRRAGSRRSRADDSILVGFERAGSADEDRRTAASTSSATGWRSTAPTPSSWGSSTACSSASGAGGLERIRHRWLRGLEAPRRGAEIARCSRRPERMRAARRRRAARGSAGGRAVARALAAAADGTGARRPRALRPLLRAQGVADELRAPRLRRPHRRRLLRRCGLAPARHGRRSGAGAARAHAARRRPGAHARGRAPAARRRPRGGAGGGEPRPPGVGHGDGAGRRAAALLPALRQRRRAQPRRRRRAAPRATARAAARRSRSCRSCAPATSSATSTRSPAASPTAAWAGSTSPATATSPTAGSSSRVCSTATTTRRSPPRSPSGSSSPRSSIRTS